MIRRIVSLMHASAVVAATFSDDFNDNSRDTTKWPNTGNGTNLTASEVNSEFEIVGTGTASGQAFLESKVLDFTGSTGRLLEFDIVTQTMGTVNGTGESGIYIYKDGQSLSSGVPLDNYARYLWSAGSWFQEVKANGSLSRVIDTPAWSASFTKLRFLYDTANNRWLFYTWTTGTWTLRFTSASNLGSPTKFIPSTARIRFWGNGAVAGAGGHSLKFDNVTTDIP